MTYVRKLVTEDSFDATGVLIPAGHFGTFDTERLRGDEKHLFDADDLPPAMVEIAAIGPTGPNPKMPQQLPPDARQGPGGSYVTPGKVLVGEVTNPQEERIEDAGLRDPDAEKEVTDKLTDIMGNDALTAGGVAGAATTLPAGATLNNDDDALVDGTVERVVANLGAKTDDELAALKAAENDREKPRKGVLSAVDAEIASREEKA